MAGESKIKEDSQKVVKKEEQIRKYLKFFFVILVVVVPFSFHITPHRHVTVWTQFGATVEGGTSHPGIHLKFPFTKGHDVFVQEDLDTVVCLCSTMDGIDLEFNVAVSNRCPARNAESIFNTFGEDFDRFAVYANVEILMQQICSKMKAEEVCIDKFDQLDDLLLEELQLAQKAILNTDGSTQRAATGLDIIRVKVYKPISKNSDILSSFKKRAEAAAAEKALKADEGRIQQDSLNQKKVLEAELSRERQRNAASEARLQDSNEAALFRSLASLEAEQKRASIQHAMDLDRAKKDNDITRMQAITAADAKKVEAAANKELLTEEYLRSKAIEAYYNNAKFVIGDKIPSSWLGGLEQLK